MSLLSIAAACAGGLACHASGPDAGALLVVAPRGFHEALGPFIEHKRERLASELAALEDCLGAPGADDPERLKRFLYTAWRERGVRYVLLVGDADVLPVRYMVLDRVTPAAFDYAFYPSDLYYADLAGDDGAFEDWNGAASGFHGLYFGEVRGEKNKADPINFDGVDYRPDVAVGRWPVSTPEDAARVAAKSIAYEQGAEKGEVPQRAGLFMVAGWVDARERMGGWVDRLPAGWSAEKRFYNDGAGASAPPPSEEQLVSLMNGGLGLVLHAGHGSDDSWEGCLAVSTISKLTSGAPTPVMLSAGCSTARFATLPPYEGYVDVEGVEHRGTNNGEVFTAPPPPPACYARGAFNMTGLGERLVRDGPTGAVVYIGCNTGSQPCGLTLLEGFVEGMSRPGARVGDCWSSALSYYYEREGLASIRPNEDWYPASIFFQGMKFMVFGDPTLPLAGAGHAMPR